MHRSLFLWTGSIMYEGFFHSGKLPVSIFVQYFSCYTVSHICCFFAVGGGGFLAGGREGVPLSVFSGFLWVTSLSGVTLGLGSGCPGPFGCPVGFVLCSVSGSTVVLEGIV